jgi:DNA repair protein RadA/Sms
MAKLKTQYVCQNCGNNSPKWVGKCNACGEWNTFSEEVVAPKTGRYAQEALIQEKQSKPTLISELKQEAQNRIDTGNGELNRVLGGGLVPGSVVLIGGEPGIGKSTLILQIALQIKGLKNTIYYWGGEQSANKTQG